MALPLLEVPLLPAVEAVEAALRVVARVETLAGGIVFWSLPGASLLTGSAAAGGVGPYLCWGVYTDQGPTRRLPVPEYTGNAEGPDIGRLQRCCLRGNGPGLRLHCAGMSDFALHGCFVP